MARAPIVAAMPAEFSGSRITHHSTAVRTAATATVVGPSATSRPVSDGPVVETAWVVPAAAAAGMLWVMVSSWTALVVRVGSGRSVER